MYGGVDILIHAFLNCILVGGELPGLRTGRFTAGEISPRYQ
jgi:hypothetical protein